MTATRRPLTLASGAELWITESGSAGEYVVLLCGLGDDDSVWAAQVPTLAETNRVVVINNRGTGGSTDPSDGYSIADFADDAAEAMAQLHISDAHIVGSSMGGAIACELALAHPERVSSVSLVGSYGSTDPHMRRLLATFNTMLATATDAEDFLRDLALWIYSKRAHADGTVDALITAALTDPGPEQTAESFAIAAAAAADHDIIDRLSDLSAPVLVVAGDEDRICGPQAARELAQALPDALLVIMPGSGHQPFQEVPAEYDAVIRNFWAGLAAGDE